MESLIPKEKIEILRSPAIKTIPNHFQERSGWIFAGRLSQEKGIIELINSWPQNERLDIAGDGPLRESISELIKDNSNIQLIGTYPPGESKIFTKYEGLIFPSKWFEGSPLVTMECLATGTPIICSDKSGAKEQIEETKGGFVITGDLTTHKLVEAQANLRANFEIYSQNAKVAIAGEFSVDNWGRKLVKYLEEAVKLTS